MNRSILIIIAFTLASVLNPGLISAQDESVKPAGLLSYLPQPGEIGQWTAADSPEHVVGDDLFLLIDGGAEIYHEYGFRQAVAQGFKHKSNPKLRFNLEIYEMNSPDAAYGVYTFKTGSAGVPVDAGSAALLEEYYINAWKGNFQVTVIGFTPDKETLDGILLTARTVTAKIKESSPRPQLVELLPDNNQSRLLPNHIKYLKGNLALFNQYDFDSQDIFGLEEGVLGDYGDFKLYIFRYKDGDICRVRFNTAKEYLSTNPRFKDFNVDTAGFFFKDDKNTPFYIRTRDRLVIITQGKNKQDAEAFIDTLTKSLESLAGN